MLPHNNRARYGGHYLGMKMSKCAEIFLKHANAARSFNKNVRGEWRDSYGSETNYAHYLAWYLAEKLIAGDYTA